MDWIEKHGPKPADSSPDSGPGRAGAGSGSGAGAGAGATPTRRRRTRLAILLGAVAAAVAMVIAGVAHTSSQSMIRRHVADTIRTVADAMADHVDRVVHVYRSTDVDPKTYVGRYWSDHYLPTLGENICLVDEDGTIILSVRDPDMVGRNIAALDVKSLRGAPEDAPETFGDLLPSVDRAVSGMVQDADGESQFFGLAPSPALNAYTMVHVAEDAAMQQAGYDGRPWIIGALLLVVLVPLSVGLMYTAVTRMEAEQAVARLAADEIERRYRQLFETNGAVQLLIDPRDGRILDANRAACAFYGFDLEVLTQRSLHELSERSETIVLNTLRDATTSPVTTTSQHLRADGAVRDISVDAGPVDIDGQTKVFAVIQDITEIADKNRQVLESEAKYRSLFEQAHDAIFILDPDTHAILDTNETAVHRYGYSREELLALSLDDLSADDWRVALRRGMEDESSTSGLVVFEHLHRHRDGHGIPVEVSGRRISFGGREFIQAIVRDLTDRKQTEADLRQRNEMLSLITDNSNDLIYIRDTQGRIIYASPSVERLTGYDPGEYASVAPLLPVENSPINIQPQAVLDAIARGEAGARIPEYETEIRHRDGDARIHRVNERWVHDRDGNVVLIGTAADVTARRRAEDALRENEARLRLLVSQIPAMVWTTDRQMRVSSIAGAGLHALGLEAADLEGRFLHEIIECDDGEPMVIKAHESGLRGDAMSFEGTWRAQRLHVHVEPLTDEQNVNIGCIGIALNVTEKREAELHLARERDLVNTLLELVPDSIYFKDAFSRFQRVNKAHAQLLGVEDERDAEERTDADFFGAEFAKRTLAGEQRIMATGQPMIGEIEHFIDPEGADRWMLTSKIPIYDREGHVEGTVGISKDVTKLHLAEQRLKVSEGEFRSLALTRQLLLSELNHRVKNNLSSLMELVRMAGRSKQTTQALSEAMLARLNAMAAVHDIFAARGFDEVDLRELLQFVIPRLKASQGIDQAVHLDGPSVSILRDQAEKVAMIVQELMTNSRKYGAHSVREGSASLTWSVCDETDEEVRVRMVWQEQGGPTPVEPESFGLGLGTLVSGFASHTLNGSCVYHWDPPGFSCILNACMTRPVEHDVSPTVGAD